MPELTALERLYEWKVTEGLYVEESLDKILNDVLRNAGSIFVNGQNLADYIGTKAEADKMTITMGHIDNQTGKQTEQSVLVTKDTIIACASAPLKEKEKILRYVKALLREQLFSAIDDPKKKEILFDELLKHLSQQGVTALATNAMKVQLGNKGFLLLNETIQSGSASDSTQNYTIELNCQQNQSQITIVSSNEIPKVRNFLMTTPKNPGGVIIENEDKSPVLRGRVETIVDVRQPDKNNPNVHLSFEPPIGVVECTNPVVKSALEEHFLPMTEKAFLLAMDIEPNIISDKQAEELLTKISIELNSYKNYLQKQYDTPNNPAIKVAAAKYNAVERILAIPKTASENTSRQMILREVLNAIKKNEPIIAQHQNSAELSGWKKFKNMINRFLGNPSEGQKKVNQMFKIMKEEIKQIRESAQRGEPTEANVSDKSQEPRMG